MSIFRSVDRWVIGDGGIVLFVAVIFRKRVFGGMQFLERSVDEMQFSKRLVGGDSVRRVLFDEQLDSGGGERLSHALGKTLMQFGCWLKEETGRIE